MATTTPRPPILGSFEDIGEQVKTELTQLPGDILGQALETVGIHTGTKKQAVPNNNPQAHDDASALAQIEKQQSSQAKQMIARAALEELTRPRQQAKEKSIWEQIQEEEEQKKQMEKERQQMAQPVQLPSSGQRKVPGIKSSVKAKQQGSEIGKNARQD
jgi:hypothetical protein